MAALLASETIQSYQMTPVGLYVHIPFCDAKCHYCDFVTFVDKNPQIDSYLHALRAEISQYPGRKLKTIFIGGGTPSVLSTRQIDFLFTSIHSAFDVSSMEEATVELNPESATPEKLATFQKNGINRVSFGLQTTSNVLLSRLGRLHDRDRFFQVFESARSLGFENINVDLMYGLPGQSLDDWGATVSEIMALHPEHISAYALKVEPGTEFYRQKVLLDGDVQADMYLQMAEQLSQAGYSHYEISNFAKPGHESIHNRLYWQNAETIGVGISSASYINGKRLKNGASLSAYIERLSQGLPPVQSEEVLTQADRVRETLMLELRLKEGVQMGALKQLAIPAIEKFIDNGLAQVNNGRFALTPRGWLLSNQLFQHFVGS